MKVFPSLARASCSLAAECVWVKSGCSFLAILLTAPGLGHAASMSLPAPLWGPRSPPVAQRYTGPLCDTKWVTFRLYLRIPSPSCWSVVV